MKKFRGLVKAARNYKLFFVALGVSAVALVLALLGRDRIANLLLILVILIELFPLVWDMIQDLRSGKYGVDILAATAIATSLVMGEYWAGVVIVLMLTGGQALEDYAGRRAENELESLLKRAPRKARILRGRKEIEVKAGAVKKGDKIIVKAGEIVPVDAVIIAGSAGFDESSLTGESLPKLINEGEDILSGSVNLDGAVTAKALHSAAESQYQQIVRLVKSARASQAPFVRLADQYAVPFTIISFGIAGAAWIVSGDSLRFLQVLVVATPCPLILAAPIAIISGMSRSAKHGVIMKSGTALERLARAKSFAFDKTGTITTGKLEAGKISTFHGYNQKDVLKLAASLEKNSNHALAQAVVNRADSEKIKLDKIKNTKEISGKGLASTVKGKKVLVGRLELLKERGVVMPDKFKPGDFQSTTAFVAVNDELIGAIEFIDHVREDSRTTLNKLRKLGAKNFMLITGDAKNAAEVVAKQVGITRVEAEMLPGDKITAVKSQEEKPVAFVGDGVNDAPVLAASDVGIALGARGAPAASESADIVVMLDDFSRVGLGYSIAKRSIKIAKQSIWIGIAMSLALMLIYSTGRFSPVSGALVQELVDIVVIFNALRAHRG